MSYQFDIREFKSFPRFKEKFLSYFPKNYQDESMIDSCWNWEGPLWGHKYGLICYDRKKYLVHRMSYIIFNGLIESAEVIRHTCDNPLCVNPNHLISGTHHDNSRDMVKRNRQAHMRLNEECVKVIKWMLKYKPEKGLASKLARLHNVTPYTIYDIKKERTWKWITV